jgi:hypothetical protein
MNVTPVPPRGVPAEFRGRARQLRDRIAQEAEPARTLVAELSDRIIARIKRHHRIPRADTLSRVADAWCRQMPQHSRLALQVDLNRRGKTLRINEMRLSASEYQDVSWETNEKGVIVLVVGLEAGPYRYMLATTTLAHVSLHAIARRLQRGLDGSQDAIKRDLHALGVAHPALTDRPDGTDFVVPVPGGTWRGTVERVVDKRIGHDRALVVRTFVDGA